MLDGLWLARVHGPRGVGGGVAVFTRGQILGGDSGFAWVGTYELKGNILRAKVSVSNFDPNLSSVLGLPGNFELLVEGTLRDDTIDGNGALALYPDTKLVFRLSKFQKLA